MEPEGSPPRDEPPTAAPPDHRPRLFVVGDEPNARQPRATVERERAGHQRGRGWLEVVNVFAEDQAAIQHHIIVAPTRLGESPPPAHTLIGSLEDGQTVAVALGISDGGPRP
jgi:hypothetical protein